MSGEAKHTILHPWHLSRKARMGDFAGFELPMWYRSAKMEHLAVLTRAGLFDTSHMDILHVHGPEALALLQDCFSKDLSRCMGPDAAPLAAGRSVYGVFLNPDGHVVDDAIVFKNDAQDFVVVINAGMAKAVVGYLRAHIRQRTVAAEHWNDCIGKIDLQGPLSVSVLRRALIDPDRVLSDMPYFSFKGCWPSRAADQRCAVRFKEGGLAVLSRTGYTGEMGFEIFCPLNVVEQIWNLLLTVGEPIGVVACGLAARDSLRAGAGLPLSQQDIGGWPFIRNPWVFALPFEGNGESFTKAFCGDQALLTARDADYTFAFVGFDARKVDTRTAVVQNPANRAAGRVLTCTTDMGIGRCNGRVYSINSPDRPAGWSPRGLCCGFVKVPVLLKPGETAHLSDQRRTIAVQIVDIIRPARTARKKL